MPLPPALLARLQRRGIVDNDNEEVIAENYDDDASTTKKLHVNASGAVGCPNKWNPYHLCVDYCFDHWREGMPESRLDDNYNRRRIRMLVKYPLPIGWKEVYDPGIARHYYWNTETDEVCWLSPNHPKAVIGESAPRIAKGVFERIEYQKEVKLAKNQRSGQRGGRRPRDESPPEQQSDDSDSQSDDDDSDNDGGREIELSEYDKLKRARRRGLDPMDPAAYGDCTSGKWSSGLDQRGIHIYDFIYSIFCSGEAKTGVDATASGPLFQSRPYPAPGAILRRNAEVSSSK